MIPPSDPIESKLIMQGIHLELTEALRSAITRKFTPILHHGGHIIRIHIRLQMDQSMGRQHHFTATAQAEIGGPDLIASAEGNDAYRAIDEVAEMLDRQLQQRGGRRKEKRNHPHEVELDTVLPKVE